MCRHEISEDIHQGIVQLADEDRACALAIVVSACGSTPCSAGAQAIMDADRVLAGTIGGGSVEAAVQRIAAETLKSNDAVVAEFNMDGGRILDDAPVCGGAVRVLVDPTASRSREAYAAAIGIRRRRERGVLLTTLQGSEVCTVERECLAEAAIDPGIGFPGAQAVRGVLAKGQLQRFVSEATPQSQRREVLVEPLVPKPLALIVGGGHVGQAVAVQADWVGFEVVVIDDRVEFTRRDRFPKDAEVRCGKIGEQVAALACDPDTYVVIVTRGHQHDAEALVACARSPAAYIGMIGSGRKVAMMRRELVASGQLEASHFDRVYAPIGLDIGSVTVPEIAASIVAQLIAVRRTGSSPRIPAEK
jgi:xanthine dehydrogenase accessory factor